MPGHQQQPSKHTWKTCRGSFTILIPTSSPNPLPGEEDPFTIFLAEKKVSDLMNRSTMCSLWHSALATLKHNGCLMLCLRGVVVADILLWRNKYLSAGVLAGATVIWFLFEVAEYHFLTLLCHISITTMLVVFIWSNVAALMDRYSSVSVFIDVKKIFMCEINNFSFWVAFQTPLFDLVDILQESPRSFYQRMLLGNSHCPSMPNLLEASPSSMTLQAEKISSCFSWYMNSLLPSFSNYVYM